MFNVFFVINKRPLWISISKSDFFGRLPKIFFSTTIFILLPFLLQMDFENALGQSSDAQEAGESNGHGPSCSKPRLPVDNRPNVRHKPVNYFFHIFPDFRKWIENVTDLELNGPSQHCTVFIMFTGITPANYTNIRGN